MLATYERAPLAWIKPCPVFCRSARNQGNDFSVRLDLAGSDNAGKLWLLVVLAPGRTIAQQDDLTTSPDMPYDLIKTMLSRDGRQTQQQHGILSFDKAAATGVLIKLIVLLGKTIFVFIFMKRQAINKSNYSGKCSACPVGALRVSENPFV